MKLKEINMLIGSDDQTVILLDQGSSNTWLGTFPSMFVPEQYKEYRVKAIMPDNFEGTGFGDGVVLKVWVEGVE